MSTDNTVMLLPPATLASARASARADRAHVRVTLIQARTAGDPARDHEHACFAARMGLAPEQIACVSIFSDNLADIDLAQTDAVLVGGAGQYSVLDDLDSIRSFIAYLGYLATAPETAEVPVFASCFGFQALVVAMGGEVICDADHAEVGSYLLTLRPDGEGDPLFGSLPQQFWAQLGHKDRANGMPNGLTDVAYSERCPHQATRVVGRPQFATQFHPELSAGDNRARFLRYMEEYGKLFGKEAAQERLNSHRPGLEACALLDHFVEIFVTARASARGLHK